VSVGAEDSATAAADDTAAHEQIDPNGPSGRAADLPQVSDRSVEHEEPCPRVVRSALSERVAAGADTRPGTAAEVCLVLKEVSMVGPLKPGATGLYFRIWTLAFPGKVPEIDESIAHYEALYGSAIDDAERVARHKLSVKARQLGDTECSGRHNGEAVQCKYVTSPDD
jgi:hypothetical protein